MSGVEGVCIGLGWMYTFEAWKIMKCDGSGWVVPMGGGCAFRFPNVWETKSRFSMAWASEHRPTNPSIKNTC